MLCAASTTQFLGRANTHHAKEARRVGSGRESQLGSSPLPEPPIHNGYATYKEMLQLVWPNGQGASLLRRRLRVRVPPRVLCVPCVHITYYNLNESYEGVCVQTASVLCARSRGVWHTQVCTVTHGWCVCHNAMLGCVCVKARGIWQWQSHKKAMLHIALKSSCGLMDKAPPS